MYTVVPALINPCSEISLQVQTVGETPYTVTCGPVHLLQLCSRAPASHRLGTSLLVLLLYNCGSDEIHVQWAELRLIQALLFLHLSWRCNSHAKSLHHQPP